MSIERNFKIANIINIIYNIYIYMISYIFGGTFQYIILIKEEKNIRCKKVWKKSILTYIVYIY